MKAVIMVGGKGMRLRPLTEKKPKPLLDVGGRPLLFSIIEHLKLHGFDEIFLATNYLAEQFEEALGDGSALGVSITYSLEEEPLGTAGPLKLIEGELCRSSEPFLVMNGDLLTDANITAMLAYHGERDADFTVATRIMSLPLQYGAIRSVEGRVVGMDEKPNIQTEINAGIYLISPRVLSMMPKGSVLMTDFIRMLIDEGKLVVKYCLDGLWLDIGQVQEYERANAIKNEASHKEQ